MLLASADNFARNSIEGLDPPTHKMVVIFPVVIIKIFSSLSEEYPGQSAERELEDR